MPRLIEFRYFRRVSSRKGNTFMNRLLLTLAALTFSLGAMFSPVLKASEWDRKTVVKINAPVEVCGIVLSPGTYVFKLLDSAADRNIVQIYKGGETHLLTTLFAVPNSRVEPASRSLFMFSESPAGQSRTLSAWFYPGKVDGLEFPARGHDGAADFGAQSGE